MKRLIYILLTLSIILISWTQSQGQVDPLLYPLPSACVGSTVTYGVMGLNGKSDFVWKVYDPEGNLVPASYLTIVGRGDTIKMHWKDDAILKGGIYTFEVVEFPEFAGCGAGDPYRQDVILNSPEIFIPLSNLIEDNMAICIGKTATLDPGSGYSEYLWLPPADPADPTKQLFFTGEAGTYKVRLVDDNKNCYYDTSKLVVNPLPVVSLGNDTVLFNNQSLILDAYNSDFVSYSWSTTSNFPSITVAGLTTDQNYWVTVTDLNGCINSDTITIGVADWGNLRIPAAFTPNGDQINDQWYFPAKLSGSQFDVRDYNYTVEVHVYNRWGKLVWQLSGTNVPWDGRDLNGKNLPMDSYHYTIRLSVDGKTYLYKGSVTIIR